MLTPRLQELRNKLTHSRNVLSDGDFELLTMLNQMDKLENDLSKIDPNRINEAKQIFEMIVKPAERNCNICGRTL